MIHVGWAFCGNVSSVKVSTLTHNYAFDGSDRLTKIDHAAGTANDAVYRHPPGSWRRYKRTQDTTTEYQSA